MDEDPVCTVLRTASCDVVLAYAMKGPLVITTSTTKYIHEEVKEDDDEEETIEQ